MHDSPLTGLEQEAISSKISGAKVRDAIVLRKTNLSVLNR